MSDRDREQRLDVWRGFDERLQGYFPAIALTLLLWFAVVASYSILYGGVNEDEGWYLYAATLVGRGELPYVDFAYTQGPVHVYVYGLIGKLFGWNLYRGRIVTAVIGGVGLLLAMSTARALGGVVAAVVCGAVIATNAYLVYFLSIPKTYALVGFWCAGGARVLASNAPLERRAPIVAILLTLATGTRISFVAALVVLMVGLLWQGSDGRRALSRSLSVATLVGALLFLPYWLWDAEITYHNLIGCHMARYVPATGWYEALLSRATVLRELRHFYCVPLLFSGAGLLIELRYGRADAARSWNLLLLHFMAGSVFLCHFLSGVSFAEYQVALAPWLAILAGVAVARFGAATGWRRAGLVVVVAMTVVQAKVALPYPWRTSGGHRAVEKVRELASDINLALPSREELLTFHTYLAVESNRDVPRGFELSLFSYYPSWSRERCRRYRVVNDELIVAALAQPQTGGAFIAELDFQTDAYTHAVDQGRQTGLHAELEQMLLLDYRKFRNVSDFGQFRDQGKLWLRRSSRPNHE